MPLTNHYLKYSPEITLEIFTLIWNKLIKSGWRPYISDSFNQSWDEFKIRGYIGQDNKKVFFQYPKDDQYIGCKETTVQEILGYDPFVKEKFVLPRQWKVVRNLGNHEILNEWANNNLVSSNAAKFQNASGYVGFDGECAISIGDYPIITFDQFKKYVLKQPIKHGNDILDVVEDTIECEECNGTGEVMVAKLYPNGHTEVNEECPVCGGEGVIEQPKQPLKQAVHCKNQEEWDFVSKKIGYKFLTEFGLKRNDTINTTQKTCECKSFYERRGEYQLLSFQEWCDLNGYKMENNYEVKKGEYFVTLNVKRTDANCARNNYCFKQRKTDRSSFPEIDLAGCNSNGHTIMSFDKKGLLVDWRYATTEEVAEYDRIGKPYDVSTLKSKEVKFEVGDYVVITANSNNSDNHIGDIGIVKSDRWEDSNGIEISVKVKVHNRYSGSNYTRFNEMRHATPEEINNHLISIGQIPAGEPLNTGIEPDKDGMFKYTTYAGTTHVGKTSTIPGPLKMTLSIDDEELPMVSIIKTNSIKQLLNND